MKFFTLASASGATESVNATKFLDIGNIFQLDFVGGVNG
jgi:hypothetical protein